MDAARIDRKQKIFYPDKNVYKINDKGEIIIMDKKPVHNRMKCAIVRDEQYIYLLGGMIGINKIVINSC